MWFGLVGRVIWSSVVGGSPTTAGVGRRPRGVPRETPLGVALPLLVECRGSVSSPPVKKAVA
jgi:hypothetical protein